MYTCDCPLQGYLPDSFTCSLEVEGYINQQLSQLRHTYLQEVNDIKFMERKEKRQVAIVQPYWERGSLKDLIYGVGLCVLVRFAGNEVVF